MDYDIFDNKTPSILHELEDQQGFVIRDLMVMGGPFSEILSKHETALEVIRQLAAADSEFGERIGFEGCGGFKNNSLEKLRDLVERARDPEQAAVLH